MSASTALQVAVAVAVVIVTAYAAGRIHQWYRHGLEREVAYREGYDEASHALFHLATRSGSAKRAAAANDYDKNKAALPRVRLS
jgi:hypothetical protein